MSNSNSTPSNPSPSPEETAFDALLTEATGGRGPTDQANQILHRLRAEDPPAAKPNLAQSATESARHPMDELQTGDVKRAGQPLGRDRKRNDGWMIGAGLATAAAILLVVGGVIWQRQAGDKNNDGFIASDPSKPKSTSPIQSSSQLAKGNQAKPSGAQQDSDRRLVDRQNPTESLSGNPSDKIQKTPTLKSEELVVSDDRSNPSELAASTTGSPVQWAAKLPKVKRSNDIAGLPTFVSKVDASAAKYWDAIGLAPTPEVELEAWQKRMERRMGIRPNVESIQSDLIYRWLSRSENSNVLAARWINSLGTSWVDWELPESEAWRDDVANAFMGKQRADVMVAKWLHQPDHPFVKKKRHQDVVAVAGLVLDADLRCVRCHEGNQNDPTMASYWSFTSMFQPWKETFYETMDGRQVLAKPGLPKEWSKDESAEVDSMKKLAQQQLGSRRLAAGIVDSLWKWVHGRPFKPSTVDFRTSTADDSLARLRDQFIDDLMESNFSLGRTLAAIMASPTNRRSVPPAMFEPSGFAQEISRLRLQMDSFAAEPPSRGLGLGARIAHNLRMMGRSLDRADRSALAQIKGETGKSGASNRRPSIDPTWDYPNDSDELPAAWLMSIDDDSEKVRHLAYLAGRSEAHEELMSMAAEMLSADWEPEIRLQRLWWTMEGMR